MRSRLLLRMNGHAPPIAACLVAVLATDLAAQGQLAVLGPGTGKYGYDVASTYDFDGDGYNDILIGVPGQERVELISGKTLTPIANVLSPGSPGELFGSSVAWLGDVNQDGYPEFLVGACGYKGLTGRVWIYDGAYIMGAGSSPFFCAGTATRDHFGIAIDGIGDVDLDGKPDFIVGATQYLAGPGYVEIYSTANGGTRLCQIPAPNAGQVQNESFGNWVTGTGDLNGDGVADFAVGDNHADVNSMKNVGALWVYSGSTSSLLATRTGAQRGEEYGHVNGIGDVTGDGVPDMAVGADCGECQPRKPGYVEILSGSSLPAWPCPPWCVYVGQSDDDGFGIDVASAGHVDNDPWPDVIVGAHRDMSAALYLTGTCAVSSYSTFGQAGGNFGGRVDGLGDVTGDGRSEVVIADYHAGYVYVYSPCSCAPNIDNYCTSKINSKGCTPTIGSSGCPGLTGPDDFYLTAYNIINNKNGIFFWGVGRNNTAFQGGTLCVAPPMIRTKVQNSNGNPPPDDCSGTLSYHFSQAYMNFHGLTAGMVLNGQWWYRDPALGPPHPVGLTDGIEWKLGP